MADTSHSPYMQLKRRKSRGVGVNFNSEGKMTVTETDYISKGGAWSQICLHEPCCVSSISDRDGSLRHRHVAHTQHTPEGKRNCLCLGNHRKHFGRRGETNAAHACVLKLNV